MRKSTYYPSRGDCMPNVLLTETISTPLHMVWRTLDPVLFLPNQRIYSNTWRNVCSLVYSYSEEWSVFFISVKMIPFIYFPCRALTFSFLFIWGGGEECHLHWIMPKMEGSFASTCQQKRNSPPKNKATIDGWQLCRLKPFRLALPLALHTVNIPNWHFTLDKWVNSR